MANATKTKVEVKKIEDGVELSLSTEEAQLLADIFARIGGSGRHRDLTSGMSEALRTAGVRWRSEDIFREHAVYPGATFRNPTFI